MNDDDLSYEVWREGSGKSPRSERNLTKMLMRSHAFADLTDPRVLQDFPDLYDEGRRRVEHPDELILTYGSISHLIPLHAAIGEDKRFFLSTEARPDETHKWALVGWCVAYKEDVRRFFRIQRVRGRATDLIETYMRREIDEFNGYLRDEFYHFRVLSGRGIVFQGDTYYSEASAEYAAQEKVRELSESK